MDTAASSPPSAAPRPRGRAALPGLLKFSIRELLLLTTTVAALVAVFLAYYRDSQPFQQSHLTKTFGTGPHIRKVAAAVHPQTVSVNGGGGGGGTGNARTIEYGYTLDLPVTARGPFMAQLERDAQAMLSKDRPASTGTISGYTNFTLSYHGGPSRGVLMVRRVDISEEEMDLSILMYEHKDR
jgi:hypothetical protein